MSIHDPSQGRPRWTARLLVGMIRFYQQAVSPYLGHGSCRFEPTCSEYTVEAIRKYGALRGSILSVWRILRCNPWGGYGYDPPKWFGESNSTEQS